MDGGSLDLERRCSAESLPHMSVPMLLADMYNCTDLSSYPFY